MGAKRKRQEKKCIHSVSTGTMTHRVQQNPGCGRPRVGFSVEMFLSISKGQAGRQVNGTCCCCQPFPF